jgi:hypothetical protein
VTLTPREKAILDFERMWWAEPGSKESGIRQRLSLSTTRYYQLLSQLLDTPEAMAYDPLLVRRLRRERMRRRKVKFEGRSGAQSKGR